MGFWDFFKKKGAEEKKETLPEINKNDFVDDSDPSGESNSVITQYGTNLPIDLIYSFLNEDNESKGHADAISNPDNSYKEMNLSLIRSRLEVKLKQVRLKYNDSLREIEFHIQSRSQSGLIDMVELLKARKEMLEKHINELDQMEKDLQNGALYITGIFKSYERGFLRGLAALSLETFKIK
ncbi:hypothetical protein Barb7_01040 [Bacteroidales bacterium Barb7]|nr:hypothetical protein Barb7_01040 [Bacteroidales bacterium Barb7]